MSRICACSLVALGALLGHVLIADVSNAQPENDDCSQATPITDGTHQGTTLGASVDGSSTGCFDGTGPDVWYLYTATCEGVLELDTCGSGWDTSISIQDPDCSGNEVTCNEDCPSEPCSGSPWESCATHRVLAGEQKLIRVSGWQGASGLFELHVSCSAELIPRSRPSVDHCDGAVFLDVPSITLGTTTGAGHDPAGDLSVLGFPRVMDDYGGCGRHEQDYSRRDDPPGVWYQVVGTGNRMSASVVSDLDHSVIVYCDSCDHLICVSGFTSRGNVNWCSRAGQVYTVWVFARLSAEPDDFELSVSDDGTPCYGAVDCTPVEVVDTFIVDNGDADGWADTHETVGLRFTVTNRSAADVTGLVARLSSDDSKVACIAEPVVHIGDLAAGETKPVASGFTFRVGAADRAGADLSEIDEFSAAFRVSMSSAQFEDLNPRRCSLSGVQCDDHGDCLFTDVCADKRCWISGKPCGVTDDCGSNTGDACIGRCSRSGLSCIDGFSFCEDTLDFCVEESQELRVDLDLDTSGGSGPTEFFEGFESGNFGNFTKMDLDAVLHGAETSDGSRCQYNDPSTDGIAFRFGACWPGVSVPHANAFFWQVDDGRSFSGLRSLYMGEETAPGMFTTPLANLEAIRTTEPINLGWGRACSGTAGSPCVGDADCPPAERCFVVSPELTFKHQASLMDDRWQNTFGHSSASSGVVQVQVVDALGEPEPPWQTIEPKVNRYDSFPMSFYFQCYFDPIDDGNTEDDFFGFYQDDPPIGSIGGRYLSVGGHYVTHADWEYLGPSSTCFPQRVFASAGDSDDPFDPLNLNGPVQGPGLQGATGLGTWVEPVFSLDRFRGQSIRLRFLTSSFKMATGDETWRPNLFSEEGPEDDGWWIDDVTITHTLMTPATVTVDSKDNAGLAFDADGDCVADDVDVIPDDPQVWALPGEVIDLTLLHTGGADGTTTLRWGPATTMGATAVDFIVVVDDGASCLESNVGPDRSAIDSITSPSGVVRRFLIQAENDFGRGELGTDSLHNARTGCN